MTEPSINLRAALVAAKLGLHVFPVRPDKKPFTAHGCYDATVDVDTITKWWTQWPSASIGMATGTASGVIALDVDVGKNGFESLDDLVAQHGALPATPTTVTGGGGRHYLFKHPGVRVPNSVSTLGKGLDVRGDGGYIILPPSKHASGKLYAWQTPPGAAPLADLPTWLHDAIINRRPVAGTPSVVAAGNPLASTEPIGEGGRNGELFRMASVLRAQGMEEDGIYQTLVAVNLTRCKPPLEDAELQTIARSASRYEAGPQLVEDLTADADVRMISGGREFTPRNAALVINETDLGNAHRLFERHGMNIRHVTAWQKWLLWTGTHWQVDTTQEIDRLCNDTAAAIHDEVRALIAERNELVEQLQLKTQEQAAALDEGAEVNIGQLDTLRKRAAAMDEQIKYLSKHAKDSESDRALSAMKRRAATLREIAIGVDQLDANPFLFNVANGTLNLKTGQLLPHDRGDLLTQFSPVPYDLTAEAPHWKRFLSEIMCEDAELVSYLQRAVGYSLTGSVDLQVLFFLHGDGENGKSTFINVLTPLLGTYGGTGAATLLATGERHPTEIADLCGRRAVFVSEPEGRRLPTAQIKRLTSEESIKARRMNENFWEFKPTHKLWVLLNKKPEITDTDHGIWRRIKVIPFKYRVLRRNLSLKDELLSELPGILNWAVQGYREVAQVGLPDAGAVKGATANYRGEEDTGAQFLDDCGEPSAEGFESTKEIISAYRQWAMAAEFKPINAKELNALMQSHGYIAKVTRLPDGTQCRGYLGFKLHRSGGVRAAKES